MSERDITILNAARKGGWSFWRHGRRIRETLIAMDDRVMMLTSDNDLLRSELNRVGSKVAKLEDEIAEEQVVVKETKSALARLLEWVHVTHRLSQPPTGLRALFATLKVLFLCVFLCEQVIAQQGPIRRNSWTTNVAGTPVLGQDNLSITNLSSGTNWWFYAVRPETVARLIDVTNIIGAISAGTNALVQTNGVNVGSIGTLNFDAGVTGFVSGSVVTVGVNVSAGAGDAGGTNARQFGTLVLTNLSGNPIPYTNIIVASVGIALGTNAGITYITNIINTNAFQPASLNLTNWSLYPTGAFANVASTTFLTNWANAISNYVTAATNSASVTGWITLRQPASANLTNWSNIPTGEMANVVSTTFLTNWANAVSNYVTAATNSASVTGWIVLRQPANVWLTNISGTGAITNLVNASTSGATWLGWIRSTNNGDALLKTVTGSGAITLTDQGTNIDINTSGAVGEANVNGEVSVTNNANGIYGLVYDKVGITNRLKSISSGNGIIITNNGTNLPIAIDPAVVASQGNLTSASNFLFNWSGAVSNLAQTKQNGSETLTNLSLNPVKNYTNAITAIYTNGVLVGDSGTNIDFVSGVTGYVSGASVRLGVNVSGTGGADVWTNNGTFVELLNPTNVLIQGPRYTSLAIGDTNMLAHFYKWPTQTLDSLISVFEGNRDNLVSFGVLKTNPVINKARFDFRGRISTDGEAGTLLTVSASTNNTSGGHEFFVGVDSSADNALGTWGAIMEMYDYNEDFLLHFSPTPGYSFYPTHNITKDQLFAVWGDSENMYLRTNGEFSITKAFVLSNATVSKVAVFDANHFLTNSTADATTMANLVNNPNVATNILGAGSVTVTSNNQGGWTITGAAGGLTTNVNQFLGVPLSIIDGALLTNINVWGTIQLENHILFDIGTADTAIEAQGFTNIWFAPENTGGPGHGARLTEDQFYPQDDNFFDLGNSGQRFRTAWIMTNKTAVVDITNRISLSNVTASKIAVFDASKFLTNSTVDAANLGYLTIQIWTNLAGTGAITNMVNASTSGATWLGWIRSTNNGDALLKTVTGSGAITITDQGTNIDISTSGGVGEANVNGEVSLTNNANGIYGLVYDKAGVTNRLKSISQGNGIVITNNGTNLPIAIDPAVVASQANLTSASNFLFDWTGAVSNYVTASTNSAQVTNWIVFRQPASPVLSNLVGTVANNVTNVVSLSTTNATSKPLTNSYANGVLTLFGLEQGANITLTPNGSNIVVASTATGGSLFFTNQSWVEMFGDDSTAERNNPGKPYKTVTNAIATGQPNDMINVGRGYWTNEPPMVLSNGMSLRGVDWNSTILYGTNEIGQGAMLSPGHNSVIENLQVVNTSTNTFALPFGSRGDAGQQAATNVFVRNCRIFGYTDASYFNNTNSFCRFYNCQLQGAWDVSVSAGPSNIVEFFNCDLKTTNVNAQLPDDQLGISRAVFTLSGGIQRFYNCTITASNGVNETRAVYSFGGVVDLVNTKIFSSSTNAATDIWDIRCENGTVNVVGSMMSTNKVRRSGGGVVNYDPIIVTSLLTNISLTGAVTNVVSLSTTNATSKPLTNSFANGIVTLFGLEEGANVTLTPNGSNIVVASTASGGGVSTNSDQFAANTTLTLKSGVNLTNIMAWPSNLTGPAIIATATTAQVTNLVEFRGTNGVPCISVNSNGSALVYTRLDWSNNVAFRTNFAFLNLCSYQAFTNALKTNIVLQLTNVMEGVTTRFDAYGAGRLGNGVTNAWNILCTVASGTTIYWPPGVTNGNFDVLVNSNQVVSFTFMGGLGATNILAAYRVMEGIGAN